MSKTAFTIEIIPPLVPKGDKQQEFIVDLMAFVADRLDLEAKDFFVIGPSVYPTYTEKFIASGG